MEWPTTVSRKLRCLGHEIDHCKHMTYICHIFAVAYLADCARCNHPKGCLKFGFSRHVFVCPQVDRFTEQLLELPVFPTEEGLWVCGKVR